MYFKIDVIKFNFKALKMKKKKNPQHSNQCTSVLITYLKRKYRDIS